MTEGRPPSGDAELHLAYAEASVMLIESLMITLVERNVLTLDDLTAGMEDALEAKKQLIAENRHPQLAAVAMNVLKSISNSVRAASLPRRESSISPE